jgi:flagellar motor switch protein FliM
MDVLSQEEIEAMASLVKASKRSKQKSAEDKPQSVQVCNFRSAGQLSNENARVLTALHETFARHLASSLDTYLETGLEVKLHGVEQIPMKDHVASIPPLSYIVPYSQSAISSTLIVECTIDVVFPIIELLLGGLGVPLSDARELSEIEEEIMQGVTSLVARQAENTWHLANMSLVAGRRIKSTLLYQYCSPNEKVTIVKFEIEIAGTTGSIQLVLPATFANAVINQTKLEQPQRKSKLRHFPGPGIRERILDCDFLVTAGLPQMRVTVRDLVALQPGCVLKLRAPLRTPGMLTVEGEELFEVLPVRNGSQKAAQLGRQAQRTNKGRE